MTKENLYGKPAPRFPEHWIWQTEFSWHATAQQHLHSRLSSHCLVQSASVCHNHVVLSQLRTCLLSLVPIEQQHSGPLITDVSLDVFWSQNTENIVLPSILSYSVELYICKKKKKKKVTTSWYCSASSITDGCGWWRGKSWASCLSRHILLYMPLYGPSHSSSLVFWSAPSRANVHVRRVRGDPVDLLWVCQHLWSRKVSNNQ